MEHIEIASMTSAPAIKWYSAETEGTVLVPAIPSIQVLQNTIKQWP